MTTTPVQAGFDYSLLDKETRQYVERRTKEIKSLWRMTAQAASDIGKRLVECKKRVPYRLWAKWLDAEFGWSIWTAQDLMRVHECLGHLDLSAADINMSALKLICKPGVPDHVRETALDAAQNGTRIGTNEARELIREYRPGDAKIQIERLNERRDQARTEIQQKEQVIEQLAQRVAVVENRELSRMDKIKNAVTNLQVALADSYGVPLRRPVREALEELQTLVTEPMYEPDDEWMNAPMGALK